MPVRLLLTPALVAVVVPSALLVALGDLTEVFGEALTEPFLRAP
jgi:hypothetical protein